MADAHHLVKVSPNPKIASFGPGDTVRVNFQIREGARVRVQSFEGVVLRKRGGGPAATFTVRRTSYNVGVERIFPLYSPLIESITVLRRGDVRRARLYYLRGLSGRRARVKERRLPRGVIEPVKAAQPEAAEVAMSAQPEAPATEKAPQAEAPEAAAEAQPDAIEEAQPEVVESSQELAPEETESSKAQEKQESS